MMQWKLCDSKIFTLNLTCWVTAFTYSHRYDSSFHDMTESLDTLHIVKFFRPTSDKRKSLSLKKVQLLFQEAFPYMRSQQYGKARTIFLQALKLRNEIEEQATIEYLLSSLGSTWLFEGLYDQGIAFWTEYLSRYPGDGPAFCSRAGAFWYSSKLTEALDDFSRALELQPFDILALSGRGQILAEIGQNERAMADLDLALQLLKDIPELNHDRVAWHELIEAYVRNGRGATCRSRRE
jgi:tetratricopeptide (TPR) repeat protein